MTKRDSRYFACCVAFSFALPACKSSKGEARALLSAAEQFRKASNEGKSERLSAVRAVVCSDEEVCRVKNACLRSFSATVEALELKNTVERGLLDMRSARISETEARARDFPEKLERAEKLLEEGHAAMNGCEQGLIGIQRKYYF